MNSDGRARSGLRRAAAAIAGPGDAALRAESVAACLPDPSLRLVNAFRAVASRMAGLAFVNPVLEVEAVGFAPWQGRWLGVMLTPWFMNLVLAPRDPAAWQSLEQGARRSCVFPAGEFDFIGARDPLAGDYQFCSLFSPVLQFEDQDTARQVARLAREALFDARHAEPRDMPVANLSPAPARLAADAGPLRRLEDGLEAVRSKRDFLRGRWLGDDHGPRG